MKYYPIGKSEAIRKAFGKAFLNLAKTNKKILAITADLGGSLSLGEFAARFPKRYFNCGVAEQNMVSLSAGLAMQGFTPFACTFGCFLTRAVDQVRQSINHNSLNVKLVGSHSGVSDAQDGASAHALEDLAIFRSFPNMAVVVISDANQMLKALPQIADYKSSVYLRLYREPLPTFNTPKTPFKIGKANILRSGKDVTLIGCGPILNNCLKAAGQLKNKVSVEVIGCHTIKPIDKTSIIASAKKTKKVVTVEDHYLNGGLGSAVAELLSENYPVKLKRIAVTKPSTTGTYKQVIKYLGLDTNSIIKQIERLV